MTAEGITAVAVGVVRRGGDVLVTEFVPDACYRPVAAPVAFGEHSRDALHREFESVFGVDVAVGDRLAVFERPFDYEGERHHEVVFCYDVDLVDRWPYDLDAFEVEDRAEARRAVWMPANAFAGEADLYPECVASVLVENRPAPAPRAAGDG